MFAAMPLAMRSCANSQRLQAAAKARSWRAWAATSSHGYVADGPQPADGRGAGRRRLLAQVAEAFEIGEHRLRIGLSIGIAVYPTDGHRRDGPGRQCRAALYRGQSRRSWRRHFFEHNMDMGLRQRRALLSDLRLALERDRSASITSRRRSIDGEIFGFEALARWRHPLHGLCPRPASFRLPKRTALIMTIGEWILREACREAASWAPAAADRRQSFSRAIPARRPAGASSTRSC